ncbi:MAG: hypothetical protein ACFFFG_16100 [Candidatus Thorarchaeota archaeon]
MPKFGDRFSLRKINKVEYSPDDLGFGFMDSPDGTNADRKDKPIPDELYNALKKELQEVREEVNNALQQTRTSIEVLITGIHGEIKGIFADIREIKHMAKVNRRMIEKVSLKTPGSSTNSSKISTGLDILMQVPRHLRGTYGTVMKAERGVTAQEVAARTGKSRPTESDYLNQLTDKGLISKMREGKKVLFYSGEGSRENGNGSDDDLNHAMKKTRMAIRISDEEEI